MDEIGVKKETSFGRSAGLWLVQSSQRGDPLGYFDVKLPCVTTTKFYPGAVARKNRSKD